ncbi:hypothetical protein [Radiobacillus deserti]|uniref:Uncharacterized protein n=1 Tax=Radiobacillus deserti TaxID=2594883 RepID=A0A516KKJ0_9BACI|nr:hypothetical protein [Radiobacillus deserti]QDP41901.1 hypothetical protein FN924_18030 [Radiobacillus deserti]
MRLIFLWIFLTTFIISYLTIYDYLECRAVTILINLLFLALSVYFMFQLKKERNKQDLVLFGLLILFIIISLCLIIF